MVRFSMLFCCRRRVWSCLLNCPMKEMSCVVWYSTFVQRGRSIGVVQVLVSVSMTQASHALSCCSRSPLSIGLLCDEQACWTTKLLARKCWYPYFACVEQFIRGSSLPGNIVSMQTALFLCGGFARSVCDAQPIADGLSFCIMGWLQFGGDEISYDAPDSMGVVIFVSPASYIEQ